jgi:hypothetical protein
MLEINKMEPHSGLQAFTLHSFAYKSEDSERNQLGRSYSRVCKGKSEESIEEYGEPDHRTKANQIPLWLCEYSTRP